MPSALHQPRSRRTLLVAAVVIAASAIPGSILVDLCPMRARDPAAADAIARWRAHSTPPEILVLGSSRTGRSIDAALATSTLRAATGDQTVRVFNGALPAGDAILMKYLAGQMLDRADAPRLVVIEVSADTTGRRNPLYEFAIDRQFTLRDDITHASDILRSGPGAIGHLISSRLIPFYRHRAQLRTWAAQTWDAMRGVPRPEARPMLEGLTWADMIPPDLDDRARAQLIDRNVRRLRSKLADYETEGQTPQALQGLVKMFRARGVQIIFYQPPLHSAHRAAISQDVQTRFRAFLERLGVPAQGPLIDCADRLPDEMFRDNDHADVEGRAIVTRLLVDEALAPAWSPMR